MNAKKLFIFTLILSIIILLPLVGCMSPELPTTSSANAPASLTSNANNIAPTLPEASQINSPIEPSNTATKTTSAAPRPGIEVVTSFPTVAPALNQTAELRCVITNHHPFPIYDMCVKIELPEAFEFISGHLSWNGDLQPGQQVTEISAIVKSVETGNWTINTIGTLNPQLNIGIGFAGPLPIYISIKEYTAEWRTGSPYGMPSLLDNGGTPATLPPPLTTQPAPSSLINVELAISKLPVLNEPVDLTCTVLSDIDFPDTFVQIKQIKGINFIDGKSEWQGDLKSKVPISFTAQVVFLETGKYSLEANARHIIDAKNSIGGLGMLYIQVLTDHNEYGWKPAPPKIVQINPENEKFLVTPISDEIEEFTPGAPVDLPKPLPINLDGKPLDEELSDRDGKVS